MSNDLDNKIVIYKYLYIYVCVYIYIYLFTLLIVVVVASGYSSQRSALLQRGMEELPARPMAEAPTERERERAARSAVRSTSYYY